MSRKIYAGLLEQILSLLENVTGPNVDGWYKALCPLHPDTTESLGVTAKGFSCFGCGQKGNLVDLALKMGIPGVKAPNQRRSTRSNIGLTLAQLSKAKGLPLDSLKDLGWHDVEWKGVPAVSIPYRDTAGNVLREQLRLRLDKGPKKDSRFMWAPGQGVWPMGLDRLDAARKAGYLLIVEGPTDFATCVCGDIPVLAVPGANAWKRDWAAYLTQIPRVIVWREPGDGGTSLVRAIANSRSDLLMVEAPGEAKDPCALRQLAPEGFRERMAELITNAQPAGLEPGDQQSSAQGFDPLAEEHASGSSADRAIQYVLDDGVELFHDQHGDSFMAFRNDAGLREVWPLRSKACSEYIRWRFFQQEGKGLPGEALSTTRGTLGARARFDGRRRELVVRVANDEGALWYDLGNWRSVKVTTNGWEVVQQPPVVFRHYQHQLAQVEPRGEGALEPFLDLLNLKGLVPRLLVKIYLVAALLSGIPLPILLVHGEQGSAKSMLLKLLRALLDPSSLGTLAPPDNLRGFIQMAAHNRTIYLDNLTRLPDWLSDALCRLCTGEGFSKRELYTDDDDIVYSFNGLGGISGINLVATRADLLDRAIVLKLEPISKTERLTERVLWERFGEMRAGILGAMFDAMVEAMQRFPTVDMAGETPRLADFAQWGVAISEALGHTGEAFLNAYGLNVEAQTEAALEGSPLGQAILAFLREGVPWEGSASALLKELNDRADDLHINLKDEAWPKAANSLSYRLREISPVLRRYGVSVGDRRIRGVRRWSLAREERAKTASIATIGTHVSPATAGARIGPPPDAPISPPGIHLSPPEQLQGSFDGDGGGDGSDVFPPSIDVTPDSPHTDTDDAHPGNEDVGEV